MIGGILNEENRQLVTDAWNAKLEEARQEARQEVEAEIREEMSRRYSEDKSVLVDAMDRMLTDQIRQELEEFAQDRRVVVRQRAELAKATNESRKLYQKKLKEHTRVLNGFIMEQLAQEVREFSDDRKSVGAQRVKLSKAIVEARKEYKTKLAEHTKLLQTFMMKQLNEEIQEFNQDRRLLAEQRVAVARQLREARMGYKKQLAEQVKMLEGFILRQVTKEMTEFQTDKQALVESRVKLIREGKDKLNKTRQDFIKRAAVMVEGTIEQVLRKEMSQFREDIKLARENNFGRRLFEAFACEYMSSHWSETDLTRKLASEKTRLQTLLSEQEQKLTEAKTALDQHRKVLTEAQSKLAHAEDKANRTQELNRLLGSLSRDKRAVMEEILDGVRTPVLESVYRKYLPSVLGEETAAVRQPRRNLSETRTERKAVAVTGDRSNRLSQSVNEESRQDRDEEVGRILHLAGIQK
jgi:uncharacterized protein (UPF0335 family)